MLPVPEDSCVNSPVLLPRIQCEQVSGATCNTRDTRHVAGGGAPLHGGARGAGGAAGGRVQVRGELHGRGVSPAQPGAAQAGLPQQGEARDGEGVYIVYRD